MYFKNDENYHPYQQEDSSKLVNMNALIQMAANEYSNSPRGDKEFLDFINNYSHQGSPNNFNFTNNYFPMTEKNDKFSGMDNFLQFKGQMTPQSTIFPNPGNVNPLNSMNLESSDKPFQNQNIRDYYQSYYMNHPNTNNFNTYEQQKLLDNSDKAKEDDSQQHLQPQPKSKLPKLDIDMINYSDTSKIMSDRITSDLFLPSTTSAEANNFWQLQNLITSSNLNLKMNTGKANQSNCGFNNLYNYNNINNSNNLNLTKEESGDFQVIKPHTLALANVLSPIKNENLDNKDSFNSNKKEREKIFDINAMSTPTSNFNVNQHILSLSVSPKSAFVFKNNNK